MLNPRENMRSQCIRLFILGGALSLVVACGGGGGGGGGNAPSAPSGNVSPASSNSANLNLLANASRTSGIAPLAVSFNAIGTTADASLAALPFHEISYKWEFNDTSDVPDWAYGAMPGNRKKNIAYGPVAGHVFEKPGTWTVLLTATASSNKTVQASKTITVVVTDPASLNTVCVSNTGLPVGGVGGCPVGAAGQQVTSWAGIASLANTYKRILLKRGDVWSSDGHFSLSSAQVGGVVAAYGVGTVKPKVILASDNTAFYMNRTSDWRLIDIEVAGNGVQGHSKNGVTISYGDNILVSNFKISDVFIGIGSSYTNGLTVDSSLISGLYDASQGMGGIAMYLENTDNLSILGSKFSDSPATHVVRLQGTERTVVANNLIELAGPTRNALTIRGKTTSGAVPWSGTWTQHVVVSNNIIDNSVRGGYALYAGPQSVGHAERVRDVIVESNYIKAKDLYAADFQVAENLTVRNNVFSSYYSYVIGLGLGGNAAGSPASNGLYIYNNTIYKPDVSLTSSFSAFSFSNAGNASNIQIKNNAIYAFGNLRDGAGNGSGATVMAQGGILGTAGTNFTFSGNTADSDIALIKPWTASAPTSAIDFAPSASYAASYKYPSFGSIWDFAIKETPTVRVRGAIDP